MSNPRRTWRKRMQHGFFAFVFLLVFAWSTLGFWFSDQWLPAWLSATASLTFFGSVFWAVLWKRSSRLAMGAIIIGFAIVAIFYATRKPIDDRNWQASHQKTLVANMDGTKVKLEGVRSFLQQPDGSLDAKFETLEVDMSRISSLWFGVDRFTTLEPMAHTFMSFGFLNDDDVEQFITVSVETRREEHESSFSPLRGIFKNYELIYVIAKEQDVLQGRSDVEPHTVQLYPVKSDLPKVRQMFEEIIRRASSLRENPEFYHTLKSNCTNNLVFHANHVLQNPISMLERGVMFPGYADWMAFRYEMVDTQLPLEKAREYFRVDEKAHQFDDQSGENFSTFIRSGF